MIDKVNGHSEVKPYVVLRAPVVLDRLQHRRWIRNNCEALREIGYTFFRVSFPDERPEELWLEGWVERPVEQGPCPWQDGGSHAVHDPSSGSSSPRAGNPPDVASQQVVGLLPKRGTLLRRDPDLPLPPGGPRPSGMVVGDDGRCLLDGSPVHPSNAHVRKLKDGQQTSYVRMSDARIAGTPAIRPYRRMIRHLTCMTVTEMHEKMAQTIAREPGFYKALFCAKCGKHFKIGADGEFIWKDSDARVGI